jgi:transcriptional regulator with XRE-family HTH domain
MKRGNPIFAERLKTIRTERGLSQEELGDLVGLSKAIISKYESGINTAGIDNAKALSDALNISFNYLVGFSEHRFKIEAQNLSDVYLELSDERKKELFNYAKYLKRKDEEDAGIS